MKLGVGTPGLSTCCSSAGTLSSAEAVVKWLEVHPYLHAADGGTDDLTQQYNPADAQEELDRLRPVTDHIATHN